MLLAIDSATRVLSLALHDGTSVCAETTWTSPNRHTVELAPAIQALLAGAEIGMADLTLLAVAQGPGSFNGLRIGLSVAKGLAMSLNLPLIAVPTLDIVAAGQPPPDVPDSILIAVAQAGRGRLCAGTYHWQAGQWTAQHDVQIVPWETVLREMAVPEVPITVAGEIDADGRAAVEASGRTIRFAVPAFSLRRAGFLAEVAWARWRRGEVDGNPGAVVPFYLHQPGVPHP